MESLIRASFEEAKKLRETWVGAEHLLVAIANDPEESVARSALTACAIDGSAVSDYVASFEFDPPMPALEEGEQPVPNPHYYRVWGRAEGFAFASGSEQAFPEHILLALIWDDNRLVSLLLEGVGRTLADLQAALAELGAQVPNRPPPVG